MAGWWWNVTAWIGNEIMGDLYIVVREVAKEGKYNMRNIT